MTPIDPGAPGALSGIRVLDFTTVMSGPYCTRLLADLGAEVIKIESKTGDLIRGRPPIRQGKSSYFAALNCGKKSMVLDLKAPEAVEILHELVKEADVVVENFRPGVMRRLRLDYPTLSEINPRLVYCSISGFGQGKSGDGKGAYAPTMHALSGYDSAMRGYQQDPGRPLNTGIFIADVLGGSLAFGGIQAALVQRQRTGRGDNVDLALLDTMLSLLICEMGEAQFPQQPVHFVYKPTAASDGHIIISPTTQTNFIALCKATNHPEWLDDPRFSTGFARQHHWDEFLAELSAWTSQRTARECERILDAHDVPCSRYLDIKETMALEVVRERGSLYEIDDGAGPFLVAGTPFKMQHGNTGPRDHVSTLGGDGPSILESLLKRDRASIKRLQESGVLGGT